MVQYKLLFSSHIDRPFLKFQSYVYVYILVRAYICGICLSLFVSVRLYLWACIVIYNFYTIYTLRIISERISTKLSLYVSVEKKLLTRMRMTYPDLLRLESKILLKKISFIVHIMLYLVIYCTSQYSFGMNHDFFVIRRSIVIGDRFITNLTFKLLLYWNESARILASVSTGLGSHTVYMY